MLLLQKNGKILFCEDIDIITKHIIIVVNIDIKKSLYIKDMPTQLLGVLSCNINQYYHQLKHASVSFISGLL